MRALTFLPEKRVRMSETVRNEGAMRDGKQEAESGGAIFVLSPCYF
jgi:hypothetical protein